MADFKTAFAATSVKEGGYANNPRDHGGETYRGIARNYWKNWLGWEIVDAKKDEPDFPHNLSTDADLQNYVLSFYEKYFWCSWFTKIDSQEIANWIYDKSVNMGGGAAVKLLQRALCLNDDGVFGPLTLAATNKADPVELRADLKEQATAYYEKIVENDPSQKEFLAGWLARA
jgi:lysozyme family protein